MKDVCFVKLRILFGGEWYAWKRIVQLLVDMCIGVYRTVWIKKAIDERILTEFFTILRYSRYWMSWLPLCTELTPKYSKGMLLERCGIVCGVLVLDDEMVIASL